MIDGKGEPYSTRSKRRIVPLSVRVRPVREPLVLPGKKVAARGIEPRT